jgi:hypothetical protein
MAVTTVKYVPNLAGIELAAHGPGVIAAEHIVANQILDSAIALAPVDTGAYQASLAIEGDLDPSVYSDIRYATYLEFGTSDTPVFATLRRASETAHI